MAKSQRRKNASHVTKHPPLGDECDRSGIFSLDDDIPPRRPQEVQIRPLTPHKSSLFTHANNDLLPSPNAPGDLGVNGAGIDRPLLSQHPTSSRLQPGTRQIIPTNVWTPNRYHHAFHGVSLVQDVKDSPRIISGRAGETRVPLRCGTSRRIVSAGQPRRALVSGAPSAQHTSSDHAEGDLSECWRPFFHRAAWRRWRAGPFCPPQRYRGYGMRERREWDDRPLPGIAQFGDNGRSHHITDISFRVCLTTAFGDMYTSVYGRRIGRGLSRFDFEPRFGYVGSSG
ncbi:hypothetical protein DFH09DRAFT_1418898 [Mycena vulgaris]|nr:hypothetical protein DFH09DRAFT_1418898 [Mycena vulgaris]